MRRGKSSRRVAAPASAGSRLARTIIDRKEVGIAVLFGRGRATRCVDLVVLATQQRDVEGQAGALGEEDHGAARTQRMADPEFVVDVRIGTRDIGKRVVAHQQAFVHRLVDGAPDLLLVGANALDAGGGQCGRDDLTVNLIEINRELMRIFKYASKSRGAKRANDALLLIATTVVSLEVLARDFAGWGKRFPAAKREAEAMLGDFPLRPRTWLMDMIFIRRSASIASLSARLRHQR